MITTLTLDGITKTGEAATVRQSFLEFALLNTPAPDRLEAAKVTAWRIIEAEVDALRTPFIPKMQGQEIVYVYKAREARAFVNDLLPNADKYPHIYAEAAGLAAAGLRNRDGSQPTPATVAADVLANDTGWPQLSAAIEAVRVPTGRLLAAATTVAEVEGILAGVVWPELPGV